MRFSRYNLYVENYPGEDSTLIYNTLTKASVLMNDELKSTVLNKTKSVSEEDEKLINEIKNLGIVVDDDIDEGLLLSYWYNKTRFSSLVWNGVIVPTTDCDLACTYCYQEGAKTPYYMEKDMQSAIVEWYKRRIERDRPKQVFWVFFGGEPLLNIPAVDYTTEEMKKYCDSNNVIFQFSIVTNGINLKKDDVLRWNENGLVSIQITIDGTRDMHDKRRPFLEGRKGSFDRIFDNLKSIYEMTDIILRMNLDAQNFDDVPEFLDFLKNEGLTKKLSIFYGLLLLANVPLSHQEKFRVKEGEGAKAILKLREKAIRKGFKVTEILEGGPCLAKSECSVMIDPKGKIYKCTGHVGLEQFALGDLGDCLLTQSRCERGPSTVERFYAGTVADEENEKSEFLQRYSQYVGLQLDAECQDCVFAPICLGGCPYKSWTKYGNLKKKVCERPYYEALYKDVLKQMYTEEEIEKRLKEGD